MADEPTIIKNSEKMVNFYANSANVEASPWDIKILLGEIMRIERGEPNAPAKLFIDDHARVTMSPQHAKAFLEALRTNIEQYEAQVGPIPSPAVPQPADKAAPRT